MMPENDFTGATMKTTIRTAEYKWLAFAITSLFLLLFAILMIPAKTEAMPAFARKYNVSCNTCHAAYPRLNEFGEQFIADNYRMPNWKDSTTKTGDDMLALPSSVPLALRTQAYVQGRESSAVDVVSGETDTADNDMQAPYLIKLLSSAPLSDHISYYFYAIFAEKGDNGSVIVEDAWFSHDDVFGTDISMMLGQFQVSDLMFPRETRMTFQDFMVYRMAGLTYDRGAVFSYDFSAVDISLGLVNGNGIEDNKTINSPGYKRPDHMFDNNSGKSAFGRLGGDIAGINLGLFGYAGKQYNATGDAGMDNGDRQADKNAWGIDISGKIGYKTWWFAQVIQNDWDGFIDEGQQYRWTGAFAGVDYIHNDHWTYSLLYNYADANDLKNTDTVYEGIDINSLTFTTSYYFMRNVKGIIELNVDFLDTVDKSGTYWTGHLTSENYALVGFDAAF